MTKKIKVFFLLFILSFTLGASAQEFIKKAFVGAPFEVIPTISELTRLDMLDYYEHGMDRPSLTYFSDEVRITTLDSLHLATQLSPEVDLEMFAVPVKGDTLIAVVETLKIPAKESRVRLFNRDWNEIESIDCGSLEEWLSRDAVKTGKLADVENTLGFMTASASVDPTEAMLTFSHSVAETLTPDDMKKVAPYLKSHRLFGISSKGFKELKDR